MAKSDRAADPAPVIVDVGLGDGPDALTRGLLGAVQAGRRVGVVRLAGRADPLALGADPAVRAVCRRLAATGLVGRALRLVQTLDPAGNPAAAPAVPGGLGATEVGLLADGQFDDALGVVRPGDPWQPAPTAPGTHRFVHNLDGSERPAPVDVVRHQGDGRLYVLDPGGAGLRPPPAGWWLALPPDRWTGARIGGLAEPFAGWQVPAGAVPVAGPAAGGSGCRATPADHRRRDVEAVNAVMAAYDDHAADVNWVWLGLAARRLAAHVAALDAAAGPPPPEADAGWQPAATLPDDGSIVVVRLAVDPEGDGSHTLVSGLEYRGEPVVVQAWDAKLKTTVHPTRLSRDEVVGWRPLPAGWATPRG